MKNRTNKHYANMLSYFVRISFITLGVLFVTTSCERSEITPPVKAPIEEPEPEKPIVDNSVKKGAGISTNTTVGVWWKNIINLKPHWFYTWGTFIPDNQLADLPQNVDFVPMIWSGGGANASNVEKLNALYEAGKIKYVLGFNEPDLSAEANMSVLEALDKWQFLCDNLNPGIKLISPATSYPSIADNSWMVQFMNGVEARQLRVDYIAVHIYQPTTASLFTSPINAVYERWGKKVWITEFGVRDDNTGGDISKNRYTPEQILTFVQSLLPQIENMEAVDRYAWFNSSPTMSGLWPCALINSNGLPTIVGEYYRDLHPNTKIAQAISAQ